MYFAFLDASKVFESVYIRASFSRRRLQIYGKKQQRLI